MKLRNIRRIYYNKKNQVEALKGINLDFDTKGLISILGPSGCGKTTLLNIISGKDCDFEGELIDVPIINYLTQDFFLFESMSIFDNLKLVNNDIALIEYYLKKYGLIEHKKKRVKKCSNGQKKRVQFIRALLYKPELLLCDEPTAALDHENAKMLMEALKEVSKEIQVIVVTHDIALANKFSDRIIKMGKGIIESDIQLNDLEKLETLKSKQKRSVKKTMELALSKIKSRISEQLLLTSLYLLASLVLFTSINLYRNIQEQSSYLGIFKNGTNIVISYPKNASTKSDEFMTSYIDFDYILYKDINEIINSSDEIIGIEAFYNDALYKTNLDTWIEYYEKKFNIFKLIDFPLINLANGNIYYKSDTPKNPGFLMGQSLHQLIEDFENTMNKPGTAVHNSKYPKTLEWYRKEFGLSIIDLLSKDLLLLYGSYPNGNNEVIIAKDTAEILMKQDGYSSLEELIGQEFYIAVESQQNKDVPFYFYNTCQFGEYYQRCYEIDAQRYVDRFKVKISGISNIETDHLNLVFFDNEFAKNPIIDYYVENYDDLYFDYVRFILKPEANTDEFINLLNSKIALDSSEFKVFNSYKVNDIPLYKSPQSFFIYCFNIFTLFMTLILVTYLFIRKRFIKEQKIIQMFGYSTKLDKILHVSCISLTSVVVFTFTHSILFNWINKFARTFGYFKLVSFDWTYISLSFFIVFILGLLIEFLLGRGNYND